ncbi:MAG TPA: DUF1956 domain-containing protein [Cellvibrio sp.]|jgi:TetR/AcrR family transcriptional regulator, regulator of cefoperazone and chloramphenicol sensitivity|nr:DUF1956 domain-containing protein [Cellvibrio sp.]
MTKKSNESRTDGEATRLRILETAGELFAAGGFAETPNKAIAATANVDLASINYHFGSRNGLYQAVLIEAHRRLISLSELRELAENGFSASEKLRKLIEHLVSQASEIKGWHARVLSREVLSATSNLEVLLQKEVLPKILIIKQILSDISGIPIEAPALNRCLISVAAPCAMLIIIGRGVPGPIRDVRQMTQSTLIDHLHTFALAGLEAIGRDQS